MSKLLPVVVFSMLMAVLSHINSRYDPIDCQYRRKERFFYILLALALIQFAGLRTYYNDTSTYQYIYDVTAKNVSNGLSLTEGIEWMKIGDNPGFVFTIRLMAYLDFSTQDFLMAFAAFTIGTNLWFFRKYTCNLWLSVLLFITFTGYTFNMAAIKQCTAMALCLIATDRAIQKKYLQFALFVLLASLFHPYALMYFVVPFLFFRPWSKNTLFMLMIFGLVGIGMESMLGTLLNVTDMLGENYNAASFTGEGVNPIRLLVVSVPVVLSLLTAEQIRENEERDKYLIVNLSMLNAEIMFVGLFGTANYFARLANYFIPFQAVSIPWLLKHYEYHDRRTMTTLAVLGYVGFFYYSQSINEIFDYNFYKIDLWDYLKTLLPGGWFA